MNASTNAQLRAVTLWNTAVALIGFSGALLLGALGFAGHFTSYTRLTSTRVIFQLEATLILSTTNSPFFSDGRAILLCLALVFHSNVRCAFNEYTLHFIILPRVEREVFRTKFYSYCFVGYLEQTRWTVPKIYILNETTALPFFSFYTEIRCIESVGTRGNKILGREAGVSFGNAYLFHVPRQKE